MLKIFFCLVFILVGNGQNTYLRPQRQRTKTEKK